MLIISCIVWSLFWFPYELYDSHAIYECIMAILLVCLLKSFGPSHHSFDKSFFIPMFQNLHNWCSPCAFLFLLPPCISSLVVRSMQHFQTLAEGGAHLELTPTTISALARVSSEARAVAVGCSPPPGSGAAGTAGSTLVRSGVQWFLPSLSQPPPLSPSPLPPAPSSAARGSATSSGYVGGCTSHHHGSVSMGVVG